MGNGVITEVSLGDRRGLALHSRQGRAVIAAAVLGSALAYMSDDMLNVALPSIADDLGGGVSEMQWVVNGYFITMLSLMLIAGSFGDVRGQRQTFLAGVAVFSVGALVAAAAPTVPVLVAGRAIQGAGAAALLACGLALVNGAFGEDERSRAVGVYTGATAAATAIGPALGGLLVDAGSWRVVFLAPLALPLVAAVVVRAAVPETPRGTDRRVDARGALFGALAISTLSFALIRGPLGWVRTEVVIASVVAVVAAGAFLRAQRESADPMLPLVLFRDRTFTGGAVVTLLTFIVSAGAVLFVVVQLQTTLGYRPAASGVALVPIYVVVMCGSPWAGRLAAEIGARVPVVVGALALGAGTWWLSFVGPESGYAGDVLPGLVVLAVGMAGLGAPLTAAVLGTVDESDHGIASGVQTAVGQLAGLLMIVSLPSLAGLSGAALDGPGFADGYSDAMRICTVVCLAAAAIAWTTVRTDRDTQASR